MEAVLEPCQKGCRRLVLDPCPLWHVSEVAVSAALVEVFGEDAVSKLENFQPACHQSVGVASLSLKGVPVWSICRNETRSPGGPDALTNLDNLLRSTMTKNMLNGRRLRPSPTECVEYQKYKLRPQVARLRPEDHTWCLLFQSSQTSCRS